MKKKLLSLFMACAMIMALAVPALADSAYFSHGDTASEDLTQPITIETRTFVPTVKLTLPTLNDPSVVLNPYKIAFTGADDLVLNGAKVLDTDEQVKQVISPVYTIKNQTNVKLNYTVAVTGTVAGGVTFSSDPVSLTEKNKKAHVALIVANKAVTTASISNAANTAQDIIGFGATGATLTESDVETLWLKTSEVKSSTPKTLDDPSSVTGKTNYLAFQFKGDLTRQPTPNAWTAEDKIGAVITFTFTPESAQDFKVTTPVDLGDATNGTSVAGLSANLAASGAFYGSSGIPTTWKTKATPGWDIYNAGQFGATVDADGKISLDQTILKAIPNLDAKTTYSDKVVVSFTDVNDIPRTVEVPITVTVKS